jgi:excisionase family DNA binding protein
VSTDLRALTLGEIANALAGTRAEAPSAWIDIRSDASPVPYRHALAAAQRGELNVHRIGRRGLVRREELDEWIARQPTIGSEPEKIEDDESPAARILRREGWRPGRCA